MAVTPLKALLFLAGAVVAGVGAAYYAGVFDPVAGSGGETTIAAAPDPAKSDRLEEAPSAAGAGMAQGEGASPQGEQPPGEVVVPAFDILRAEPDGSLVIAGRAAPGSEVEVLSGSSVLAKTQAGPAGDFATVLDRALQPGDHNIVLRATSEKNVAATSVETAVVSIPTAEAGQVVALVQQPGEPSRLISVPEAAPAPDAAAPAGGEPAGAETDIAAAAPAEAPADTAPAPLPRDAAGAGETVPEAEPAPAETAGQSAAPEQTAGQPAAPAGEPSTEQAAAPAQDAGTPAQAPQQAEAAPVQEGQEQEQAVAAEARPDAASPAAEPATPAPPERAEAAPEPAAGATPFIEAVEIDGREIFVAGKAEPGRTVRVYVNDILLGQATVNPDGSFLVQTERDLPVGDYVVRADVLGADGASVVARAAVPFQRQEGEQMAAVAPAPAVQPDAPTVTDAAPGAPAAGGDTPAAGEGGAMAEAKPQAPADAAAPAASDAAAAMAPALEPADGSVIIRRGDTLWHISRRVYGRGIRYTTIYLANQDQIADPDRIWPGQIFAVPDETEEGEPADMTAIEGQTVPGDAAPEAQ